MLQYSRHNIGSDGSFSPDSSHNSFESTSPPSNIANDTVEVKQTSFKLVFTKRFDNQYQVKNIIQHLSDPQLEHETALIKLNDCTKEQDCDSNILTRPKRIAKKRFTPEIFQTCFATVTDLNDKDFQAPCSKRRRPTIGPTISNSISNSSSNSKPRTRPKVIKAIKKKPKVIEVKPKTPILIYQDENALNCELIYKSETQQPMSFESKVAVFDGYKVKSHVVLNSSTLNICLCEAGTNVIRSKGSFHSHLYFSNSTPCIYCFDCKLFLSVNEFNKHIHIGLDDIDDPFDNDELNAKKKLLQTHKYSIFPYKPDENGHLAQLDPNELSIWELFGKKFILFKNMDKTKNPIVTQKSHPIKSDTPVMPKLPKTSHSLVSVLSDDEIDNDCSLEKETTPEQFPENLPEKVFVFNELKNLKDDLILSEEE
jgi:hypothetical protein